MTLRTFGRAEDKDRGRETWLQSFPTFHSSLEVSGLWIHTKESFHEGYSMRESHLSKEALGFSF